MMLNLLIAVWLIIIDCGVTGFSANPTPSQPPSASIATKQFIEIADLASPRPIAQQLPVSLVENWSTWVLDTSGSWSKIPDSDGFVPPASVDTLFQPLDLKPPQFQLAVGFHVRAGQIRHIMPALDVCYEGGQHRNRGLCSVPRAYKWIEFHNGMFGEWKDFQIRALTRKQGEGAQQWEEVAAGPSGETIAKTIERTILGLAQSAPDDMGEGSHLVHVLIDYKKGEQDVEDGDGDDSSSIRLEYPKTGHELCIVMDDRDEVMLPANLEEEAQGVLHVTTSATMAGSESQYLPDAYKPLFHDKSLRNPLYDQFRERRDEKQQ